MWTLTVFVLMLIGGIYFYIRKHLYCEPYSILPDCTVTIAVHTVAIQPTACPIIQVVTLLIFFVSKSSLYTVSSFTEWWGIFITKMMISYLLVILGSSSCVMRYMVFVRKNHTVVVIISDALCCMWLYLTPLMGSELG